MTRWKQVATAALALMVLATAARAAPDDCEDAPDKLALARVVTTEARLNFVAGPDKQTCPSAAGACRLKAFLVPGDDVLVSATDGAYVCAMYKSQAGVETRGFLPRAALEIAPPAAATATAQKWAGKWRRDREAEIVLKAAGDQVKVAGTATYGASDPARVKRGAVNEGELDGSGKPRGQTLAIGYDPERYGFPPPDDAAPDVCAAQLQLYGRYLMARDNNKCGGMNVSFTGPYVRVAPK